MLNKVKWILMIGVVAFFVYAIYASEKARLNKLVDVKATSKISTDSLTSIAPQQTHDVTQKVKQRTNKKRIYVNEFTGDTLDLSKDKFIMILADKYPDKSISYSFSIFNSDLKTCAWSPGLLRISVYDKNFRLLKRSTANIARELEGACTQFQELNLLMGDLLEHAAFINAEFTDDSGEKYYQKSMRLGSIVDLKLSKDHLTNDERMALRKLKREIRGLFEELISFKGKKDFHAYGFAQGYKYYDWLNRVKRLRNNPSNQLLRTTDHFSAGDLLNLGLEYVGSNGNETEYSRITREKILTGLQE